MKKKNRLRVEQEGERISRTQKKKAAQAMQKTGEALVSLTDAQLHSLALPEQLHSAVLDAQRMRTHGARRRQLQYIGVLMRDVDAEYLQNQIDQFKKN